MTVLVVLRVLQRPGSWWALLGLQALLCADTYGYAPLRFLWLLSLALLGWELLRRWREWRWFLPALLITMVVVPSFIVLADQGLHTPRKALELYYNAGGEQIRQMSVRADNYEPFLPSMPARGEDGTYQATKSELALQLIGQNTRDFAHLLLDRETKPALTDYWTPQGRLYAMILVPFFFLGLGRALWRLWWRLEDRVLLAHFFGFGLPMLLTSRVHIGRLVFFLPFLLLLVASGVQLMVLWLFRMGQRVVPTLAGTGQTARSRQRVLFATLAGLLTLGVASAAWQDYRVTPSPRREWPTTLAIAAALPEVRARGSDVVLIIDDGTEREVELLNVGEFRLALYNRYRFVDLLADGEPVALDDGRPTLYYGNPMAHLGRTATLTDTCAYLYLVVSELEAQFVSTIERYQEGCAQPPEYRLLPD